MNLAARLRLATRGPRMASCAPRERRSAAPRYAGKGGRSPVVGPRFVVDEIQKTPRLQSVAISQPAEQIWIVVERQAISTGETRTASMFASRR